MTRTTIGVIAIASLCASQAYAADLPNRAAPPVFVPPVIPLTWSGCYVGGFGGFDIARVRDTRDETTRTTTTTSTTTTTVFPPVIGAAVVPGRTVVTTTPPVTTTRSTNASSSYGRTLYGGDGGGRVGCNYQTGALVIGGQLEGGYLGINGSTTDPLRTTSFTKITGGVYGAGSVKLGYAIAERTLLFIRGGAGYADLKFTAADLALNYASTVHGSKIMPLVGAGLEYKLTPNISLTGEYTYMHPGCRGSSYTYTRPTRSTTTTVTDTNGRVTQTTATTTDSSLSGSGDTSSCVDKHMIMFGLNYYFNAPVVPVVARY